MADVLTTDDLANDKKHSTFFAEVITGKTGGLSTGADISTSTNQVTGQVQKTIPAIAQTMEDYFAARVAGMAFTRVGTFTSGFTLTDMRQTLLWEVSQGGDGHEYGWTGSFLPSGKVVSAGSTPATSGGVGAGAWVDRSDVTLRSEITASVTEALRRSYAEAGLNMVAGSFEEGGILTSASDVLLHKVSGIAYSGPIGSVAAGTDPTAVGSGYVPRADVMLRVQINSQLNAVLNKANAALAAAEAAQNITLINSQTYPDEATGRAAVADGAYFKVQGSGDVACFEYRRTNSSTSVLVATYPSKSFVESGKSTAGTAYTAEGAGYESINPDATGYGITTRQDSGVSIIKGKVGYLITVNKVSSTGSLTWFGVHIKIPYGALSDLDKNFNFNAVAVAGVAPNNVNIVKEETDWGPVNNPVGIDVSKMMSGGTGVNLYQTIMASPHASVYQARTYLHILIAYHNSSSSVIDAATATWTIRPRFDSDLDVIANKFSPALKTQLDAATAGITTPKAPLTDINTNKKDSSSTATIGNVYTRIEGEQTIKTGYDVTLNNVSGFAYSYAKLFDTYATQASTKKYRVFVKSNNKDATIQVRFTNSAGWGSLDGSIGQVTNETVLQLNAANNYQATVDIDYSSADIAAFYAQTVRLKAGYVILALDNIVSSQSVVFSTYCYETTPTSSSAVDMTRGYVSTIAGLTELEQRVDSLSADLVPSYITCWGDSLTAAGGWTTTLATLSGLPVYNGGTGGENSQTIMARQGGDVMVVNNITIPATTTPVLIASRSTDGGIKTALGATVNPLLQGSAHVNPCMIGDVVGTLSWTGSSYADMNGTWTFTRSAAGSEVQIKRPTAIRTDFDINRNGSIQIIFIGQNGGYASNDDLIRQHRLMIEHSTAKHTIILGLSSGSAASRADYEAAMKLAFGRYFISLREYLAAPIYTDGVITSCYGLDDAGITPTSADLTAIASGTVPPSLLSDAVHYNTACKTVIGNMLYKKMKDLNVF